MRRRSPLTCLLPVWTAGILLFGPTPTPAQADLAADSFVLDGSVSAIAHDAGSGKTYIGGMFTSEQAVTGPGIGLSAGGGGGIDPTTFPHVSGSVSATVSDGQGGWYVGGEFMSASGQQNLIHVTAAGTVDPDFTPNPGGGYFGEAVSAVARAGTTLYVSGDFQSIGGQSRFGLAAIDTTTGAVMSWNPNSPAGGGFINAMVVSGSTIYVAGGFSAIGGQSRHNAAAIDSATGAIRAWDPSPDQLVNALAVTDSAVFLGGSFSTVGGQSRNRLAAVDATTGAATNWTPSAVVGSVSALVTAGPTLYVGGSGLAEIDQVTGNVSTWAPALNGNASSLVVSGSTVYVGGSFSSIGGQARHNLAAVDVSTGQATSWDPSPNSTVAALAVAGGKVYAGGSFSGAGPALSQTAGLARLNADGSLDTAWHPNPQLSGGSPGHVRALALASGKLYVGGGFSTVGGQSRTNLAALDSGTGNVAAWTANATGGDVYVLAPNGSTLLVGGRFTALGGQSRNGLGAVDTSSGSPTSWNPTPSGGGVLALAAIGSTLYTGGDFTSMGGTSRVDLAAVDLSSGAASSWDPAIDPALGSTFVDAVAISGSAIYVGGQFGHVGGQIRLNAAAVDAASAAPTAWNPQPNAPVSAIQLTDTAAYLGGSFSTLGQFNPAGQQTRKGLAAVDTSTGETLPFDAKLSTPFVLALASSSSRLYVGGDFGGVAGTPTGAYTQLDTGVSPADTEPPTISIATPSEGQHVVQAASVAAVFACDDADSGIAKCTGPATLDTTSPGTKTYTVTAADNAGNPATLSVSYVVDAPNSGGPPSSGGGNGSEAEAGSQRPALPTSGPNVLPATVKHPQTVAPKLAAPPSILRSSLGTGISLSLSGAKPKSRYTATITAGGKVLAVIKGGTNASGNATIRAKLSKKALAKAKRAKTLVFRLRVAAQSGKSQRLSATSRLR